MYTFDRNYLQTVVDHKGFINRIMKAQEECAEFIAEAFHVLDNRENSSHKLLSEMGDVYLTFEMLRLLLGDETVDKYCKLAEEKLHKRLGTKI